MIASIARDVAALDLEWHVDFEFHQFIISQFDYGYYSTREIGFII